MTRLRVVSSHPQPRPASGQIHIPNAFDGRGRRAGDARRVTRLNPEAMRVDAPSAWAGLMRQKCRTASAVAIRFGVTLQTACNWLDGLGVPMGDKVALAALWWPEDFRRAFGGR